MKLIMSRGIALATYIVVGFAAIIAAPMWAFWGSMHHMAGPSVIMHTVTSPDFVWQSETASAQVHQTMINGKDAPMTQLYGRLSGDAGFALFLLGCALVILVTRTLRSSRGFTRLTAAAVGIYGLLCVAVACLKPWFVAQTESWAVVEFGLPVEASTTPWFIPWSYDLQSLDFTLASVGVVIVAVALLLWRAQRLQEDTRGWV